MEYISLILTAICFLCLVYLISTLNKLINKGEISGVNFWLVVSGILLNFLGFVGNLLTYIKLH